MVPGESAQTGRQFRTRVDGCRRTLAATCRRMSRERQNHGSRLRDSTTNALAPSHPAGGDRNVEHLPVPRKTAGRADRSQPAPQLQHSDSQGKVHASGLWDGVGFLWRLARLATSRGYQSQKKPDPLHFSIQSATKPRQLREYFVLANSTIVLALVKADFPSRAQIGQISSRGEAVVTFEATR